MTKIGKGYPSAALLRNSYSADPPVDQYQQVQLAIQITGRAPMSIRFGRRSN